MKLIQSYNHPRERERGNKVHIFKCETTNHRFWTMPYMALCKCHPKGSKPYDGEISEVSCWECKAIYSGEKTR
jgi:hypothetical protein